MNSKAIVLGNDPTRQRHELAIKNETKADIIVCNWAFMEKVWFPNIVRCFYQDAHIKAVLDQKKNHFNEIDSFEDLVFFNCKDYPEQRYAWWDTGTKALHFAITHYRRVVAYGFKGVSDIYHNRTETHNLWNFKQARKELEKLYYKEFKSIDFIK